MIYPIAEMFDSWQGEGVYAGTPMFFIRLAGCTVGKPYPKERYEERYEERYSTDTTERPLHLPIYTEKCTLYDGREFPCDTDYRVTERLSEQDIMERIPPETWRVCITGGEPTMHDLEPLVMLLSNKHRVHVETSGTTDKQPSWMDLASVWITVSPKKGLKLGMIALADEFKFLVDENFDPTKNFKLDHGQETSPLALAKYVPAFLQPVNFENEVNPKNLQLCLEWQKKYRQFRVSPQMHKMVSHYVGEMIR